MWWTMFDDPHLSELIDWAAIGESRPAAGRGAGAPGARAATIAAARSGRTVISQASYTREHASANAPSGGATSGTSFDLFQAGFDANWELDVFGGNRRAVEAADASVEAAEYDRDAVLVSLMGEVGSTTSATAACSSASARERQRHGAAATRST